MRSYFFNCVTWMSLVLAALPMLAATGAWGSESPPAAAIQPATPATNVEPRVAHSEFQLQLEALLATRPEMTRVIGQNDLKSYRTRVIDLHARLESSRITLDRAFLLGAWKSAKVKRSAMDFVNRMQGLEILSQMALAVATGYDYPVGKIPASAVDATTKLYAQLERFTADVRDLNRQF